MVSVALTFDTEYEDQDAADPLGTLDDILGSLEEAGVRATFFVVGNWALEYPGRVAGIVRAGHVVGSHSSSHRNLPAMTADEVAEDLTRSRAALTGVGVDPHPLFRAPYGAIGDIGGSVDLAFRATGFRHLTWHAHGDDWRPGRTAEQVAMDTIRQVEAHHGDGAADAIVLFHSWPDPTAAALRRVLAALPPSAFDYVTADQIGGQHWWP